MIRKLTVLTIAVLASSYSLAAFGCTVTSVKVTKESRETGLGTYKSTLAISCSDGVFNGTQTPGAGTINFDNAKGKQQSSISIDDTDFELCVKFALLAKAFPSEYKLDFGMLATSLHVPQYAGCSLTTL